MQVHTSSLMEITFFHNVNRKLVENSGYIDINLLSYETFFSKQAIYMCLNFEMETVPREKQYFLTQQLFIAKRLHK